MGDGSLRTENKSEVNHNWCELQWKVTYIVLALFAPFDVLWKDRALNSLIAMMINISMKCARSFATILKVTN